LRDEGFEGLAIESKSELRFLTSGLLDWLARFGIEDAMK
jgi:hypothetical protein